MSKVSSFRSKILIWTHMPSLESSVQSPVAPFLQTDGILTALQSHYKNWDLEGCSRWKHLRKLECDHNNWLSYKKLWFSGLGKRTVSTMISAPWQSNGMSQGSRRDMNCTQGSMCQLFGLSGMARYQVQWCGILCGSLKTEVWSFKICCPGTHG